MYGYIYKTTNSLNNKIYVGQKKSNLFLHENYLGSGVALKRAIDKYGKENFIVELIDTAESSDELNEKEIYWIDKLDSRNPQIGYNIATGGTFGDSGYHDGMLGKHQSEKQKLAASKNGSYKRTEAWKLNKSISMIGNTNGHGNLGGIGKFKGKHHSEETKQKLSNSLSKIVTEWHNNLSEEEKKIRGQHISNTKKGTICITDGYRNYYIKPEDWDKYSDKYFKMSLGKYKKLMNK